MVKIVLLEYNKKREINQYKCQALWVRKYQLGLRLRSWDLADQEKIDQRNQNCNGFI